MKSGAIVGRPRTAISAHHTRSIVNRLAAEAGNTCNRIRRSGTSSIPSRMLSHIGPRAVFGFLLFSHLAQPASAVEPCARPEALATLPTSFETLTAPLEKLGAKGEYETSKQYEDRLSAVALPAEVVLRIPLDLNSLTYDADAGAFQFRSTALQTGVPYHQMKLTAEVVSLLKQDDIPSSRELRAAPDKDSVIGTYYVQNGFGARMKVAKVNRQTKAVFEPPDETPEPFSLSYVPGLITGCSADCVLSVQVPADAAKSAKSGLRAVALIAPMTPYITRLSYARRPDFGSATDLDANVTVLRADIRCIGVTDRSGVLLAHWSAD